MDKPTIAALAVIGLVIVHGVYATATGCAVSSTQASEPGEPHAPVVCAVKVAPGAIVILGLLAAAGFGVALQAPGVAWGFALPTLGGSILFMFSLGWFVYHAAITCLVIGAWHLSRRRAGPQAPPGA